MRRVQLRWVLWLGVAIACGPSAGDGEGTGQESSGTGGPSTVTVSSTDPTTGDPTSATTVSTTTSVDESTTVSTFTTSDDDEGSSDTFMFLIEPDGGGSACLSQSLCDVWAQDCPRGEKCMPWNCDGDGRWSSTRCTPLDPEPAQPGENCSMQTGPYSGIDDCDLAAMCWGVDGDTLQGECVAFCSGSEANPACEDPAASCFIGWDGVITLCLPRCDPLASACGVDEACMFDAQGGTAGQFVCMPESVVPAQTDGDDCSDAIGCGDGLVCRPAADVPGCATSQCCTQLGALAMPPACPDAMQTCLPLFPEGGAPEGLEDLCFCGVAG